MSGSGAGPQPKLFLFLDYLTAGTIVYVNVFCRYIFKTELKYFTPQT